MLLQLPCDYFPGYACRKLDSELARLIQKMHVDARMAALLASRNGMDWALAQGVLGFVCSAESTCSFNGLHCGIRREIMPRGLLPQ